MIVHGFSPRDRSSLAMIYLVRYRYGGMDRERDIVRCDAQSVTTAGLARDRPTNGSDRGFARTIAEAQRAAKPSDAAKC